MDIRKVVRANLYAPRPGEIPDPDRLAEIGLDFDDDLGGLAGPVKVKVKRMGAILQIILTGLGLFKSLVGWFRERATHDAGVKAERLRILESEMEAKDAADNVPDLDRSSTIDVLRKKGF